MSLLPQWMEDWDLTYDRVRVYLPFLPPIVPAETMPDHLEIYPEPPVPPRPRPIPVTTPPDPPPSPVVVPFDYNSFELTPPAWAALRVIAQYLNRNRRVFIKLIGHTDPVGSPSFNMSLGSLRAEAVARQLMQFGVPIVQIANVSSQGERLASQAGRSRTQHQRYRNVLIVPAVR